MLYLKFRRLVVGVLRGYDNAPTDKQLKKVKEGPSDDPGFFASRDKYPKVPETENENIKVALEELREHSLKMEFEIEQRKNQLFEIQKKDLEVKINEAQRAFELDKKLRILRETERKREDLERER